MIMKVYHISFTNNSGSAYMVWANTMEQAKEKVCTLLSINYPNSYLKGSKSGIGKQCLGLIK